MFCRFEYKRKCILNTTKLYGDISPEETSSLVITIFSEFLREVVKVEGFPNWIKIQLFIISLRIRRRLKISTISCLLYLALLTILHNK